MNRNTKSIGLVPYTRLIQYFLLIGENGTFESFEGSSLSRKARIGDVRPISVVRDLLLMTRIGFKFVIPKYTSTSLVSGGDGASGFKVVGL